MARKKSLGTKIKEFRRAHKLTQRELAEKLGIDNSTVSKWEADIYEPDATTLDKLAAIFEVQVDDLLDRHPIVSIHESIKKRVSDRNEDYKEEQDDPLSEPAVQFILRSKKELSSEDFAKMMEITEKVREMFDSKKDGD